jgi:hypothetical protein
LPLADRHYNRQKPGTSQFTPPGRCYAFLTADASALWVSSWPFAEYVKHDWAGAWINSTFRNESGHLSSELIREAVAATRAFWAEVPALGMVTFVDPRKVRHKRDPGRCYRKAGFVRPACPTCHGEKRAKRSCKRCHASGLAYTKAGLIVWQMLPDAMPEPAAPLYPADGLFAELEMTA